MGSNLRQAEGFNQFKYYKFWKLLCINISVISEKWMSPVVIASIN
jgi:hypothetical protein